MRLLKRKDDGEFSLVEIFGENIPPYAILSHTWEPYAEEPTFKDLVDGTGKSKAGYRKIRFCGEQAANDGLQFSWADTCCIDKSSSAELSEAINSMFRWYRNAAKCYVYLADVSTSRNANSPPDPQLESWERDFRRCRWFTRSWTLQELIAPASVEFFSHKGERLGDKRSLERQIHEITGIPVMVLRGCSLSQYSIEERISWAENRETTRSEDKAYSLLGLFDVYMPLIYGESKQNAFRRLRGEISKSERYNHQESSPFILTPELENADPLDHPELQSQIPEEENSTTMPSGFLYSHPLADFGFRIFILEPGVIGSNIIGHIQEFNLLDPPAYNALSYVWGQEPAIHQVVINDNATFIRPNLFHALQRIRLRTGQIHIWVDSLCINQFDDSERGVQVRQMATIYHKASSVLVWLGEEDSTSKFAMEFVPQIIRSNFQWDDSWWEQYGFTALAQILERPWFRRGWVLQEAAFSTNSTIYCGDRQVHMDHLAMAIDLVRARLSSIPSSLSRTGNTMRAEILANFHDSPAVRLLDTIEGAFRKSADGHILHHRMSLETLVDLGTFSETTDQRDTIYALLNLAYDIASFSQPDQSDAIIPDYGKNVLDVYVDFILHCCRQSGSLDIICRPWAPISSSTVYTIGQDNRVGHKLRKYPSWIASRDGLPFGDPSWRLNHRLHGNPLIGGSQKRVYNTHYGSKPHVSVGRNEDNGACDGSLYARGIVLGEVARRSTRLADAIITKECLQVLGTIFRKPQSDLISLPDTIWRTLCADRDDRGEPAPPVYRVAMLHLLQISSETTKPGDSANLLEHMSSIDIEELLDTKIPDHVKKFLEVARDVIWNRRTFRSKVNDDTERPLMGLIPQNAKVGDQVCILYGCSVPVVLRKLPSSNNEFCWQLIGDAYVYGIMDGEAIRSASSETLKSTETEFKIR